MRAERIVGDGGQGPALLYDIHAAALVNGRLVLQ